MVKDRAEQWTLSLEMKRVCPMMEHTSKAGSPRFERMHVTITGWSRQPHHTDLCVFEVKSGGLVLID